MGHGIRRQFFKGKVRALATALLVSTAIGAGLTAPANQAFAQSSPQSSFSVPAGPLHNALTVFGRQAGLQVTYLSAAANGKTSPGFSGAATREQALAEILAGSGLIYSFPNAGTVAISAPASGTGNIAADGSTQLNTIEVQGETLGAGRWHSGNSKCDRHEDRHPAKEHAAGRKRGHPRPDGSTGCRDRHPGPALYAGRRGPVLGHRCQA
ncbi:MAG: STN domain-containing protein [Agrobacterium tumefaciens]